MTPATDPHDQQAWYRLYDVARGIVEHHKAGYLLHSDAMASLNAAVEDIDGVLFSDWWERTQAEKVARAQQPEQHLTGQALLDWLDGVWSPGLRTTTFTDAQRTAWRLLPHYDYRLYATGGDERLNATMEALRQRPDLTPLFWAWLAGGYWVLCPTRYNSSYERHD